MKWTVNYKAAFILNQQRQKVSLQPEQVVILSTGLQHELSPRLTFTFVIYTGC